MLFIVLLILSLLAYPDLSAEERFFFCLPPDVSQQGPSSFEGAGKRLANQNKGTPRTVRTIYIVPKDRPFRQEVVDSLKTIMVRVQRFYAEQMEAHGHGSRTFDLETDSAGNPIVHRINSAYNDSHYSEDTHSKMGLDVGGKGANEGRSGDVFSGNDNILVIVIDNSIGAIATYKGYAGGTAGPNGKKGGQVFVPAVVNWQTMAHELGHAFGLQHDFRSGGYIMSYGPSQTVLSECHTDFLSVHPFFNTSIPLEISSDQLPQGEIFSDFIYPVGSKRVSLQVKARDPKGLHQAFLFLWTRSGHFAANSQEVKACSSLDGVKETIINFEYDGVIPSHGGTSLANPIAHATILQAINVNGDAASWALDIAERSPYYKGSLESDYGSSSMVFSEDGATLALGTRGAVELWDMKTVTKRTTIKPEGFEYEHYVNDVSFWPDETSLAFTSANNVVFWDLAESDISSDVEPDLFDLSNRTQRTNIEVFHDENTTFLGGFPIAFSPDKETFAVGDGRLIELWNANRGVQIATLRHKYFLFGSIPFLQSLAFSPNGQILASQPSTGRIELWDMNTQDRIATLNRTRNFTSIAFSPDGRILAGSFIRGIDLYDVQDRSLIRTLSLESWGYELQFSKDGSLLTAADSRDLHVWEVGGSWRKIATLGQIGGAIRALAFSPLGTIVTASYESQSPVVMRWEIAQAAKRLVSGSTTNVETLALRPRLEQNAPNPFNSQTILSYFLPTASKTRLEIFSLSGQRIVVLHQGPQRAGYHRFEWSGRDDLGRQVASGLYLYQLTTPQETLRRKLILVK